MIDDYLKLFNQEGPEYRILIRDASRAEIEPVTDINDINQGAVHNALEYHRRYARRIFDEFSLINARGEILQEWSKFWGIPNADGLDDENFALYMIGTVLAATATEPVIEALFADQEIVAPEFIGPFFNQSYFGNPPEHGAPRGATFSHRTNAIYIFIKNLAAYSPGLLRAAKRSKAAGVGIFVTVSEASELGDRGARNIGPYFNHSYFGIRPRSTGVQGSAFTSLSGESYLFFATAADFDPEIVQFEVIQQRPPARVYSTIES